MSHGTSLSGRLQPTFGCPPAHAQPPCPPSMLDSSLFCKTVIQVCHVSAIKLHLGAPSLLLFLLSCFGADKLFEDKFPPPHT